MMHRATKSVMHRISKAARKPLAPGRVSTRGPHAPDERILPTITQQDDGGWLFEWVEGELPARLYLDGKLIATVTATREYEFNENGYESAPPALEIVGYGIEAESQRYPSYATLQWRGVPGASAYIVQRLSGSNWIDNRTMPEDDSGTYTYDTPATADQTADEWRILAIDSYGRSGDPLDFDFFVVRNPAEPAVTYSIAGGTLTVEAVS